MKISSKFAFSTILAAVVLSLAPHARANSRAELLANWPAHLKAKGFYPPGYFFAQPEQKPVTIGVYRSGERTKLHHRVSSRLGS